MSRNHQRNPQQSQHPVDFHKRSRSWESPLNQSPWRHGFPLILHRLESHLAEPLLKLGIIRIHQAWLKTRSMMLHLYAVSMGLYIGYPKLLWLILIDDHSSAMWSTPRDLQPTFNPCCFCAEVLIASTFSTWSSMPASRHLWSRIITLCGIFGAECSLMNWRVHIYLHIIRFMYTISVCAWIMHRCSIAATQSRHWRHLGGKHQSHSLLVGGSKDRTPGEKIVCGIIATGKVTNKFLKNWHGSTHRSQFEPHALLISHSIPLCIQATYSGSGHPPCQYPHPYPAAMPMAHGPSRRPIRLPQDTSPKPLVSIIIVPSKRSSNITKSYQIWFWDTQNLKIYQLSPWKKNQLPQRAAANGRFWWPADTGPAVRLVTHGHAIWKGLKFPRLFGDDFDWDKWWKVRENITNKAHTKSSHIFWHFFWINFPTWRAAAPGWWACSSWRLAPRSAVLAQPSGDSATPRRTWRLCRSPGAGWRTVHWVSELWIL